MNKIIAFIFGFAILPAAVRAESQSAIEQLRNAAPAMDVAVPQAKPSMIAPPKAAPAPNERAKAYRLLGKLHKLESTGSVFVRTFKFYKPDRVVLGPVKLGPVKIGPVGFVLGFQSFDGDDETVDRLLAHKQVNVTIFTITNEYADGRSQWFSTVTDVNDHALKSVDDLERFVAGLN